MVFERLKAKALKAINGFDPSCRELIEKAGLTTLRSRREQREITFACKCAVTARFGHWFPVRETSRETRDLARYEERFARTHRCYNSPMYSMRRRLNRDTAEEGAREGRRGETLQTVRA